MSLPVQDIDWMNLSADLKGKRIGLLLDAGVGMAVEPEVKAAVEAAAKWFAGSGRDRRAGRAADVARDPATASTRSSACARGATSSRCPRSSARRSIPTRANGPKAARSFRASTRSAASTRRMELRRLAALLFGKIDYLISPTAPIPAFAAERCLARRRSRASVRAHLLHGAVEHDRAAGRLDQRGLHDSPACRSACRSSAAASTITAC